MAGLRGNQAAWAFGKQSAKGTPIAAAYSGHVPFTDGNLQPSREVGNLSETDANRDQGIAFVQTTGVEGDPGTYVRSETIHHLLEYALGARAVDDTATPDIEHTITPANAIPYVQFFKSLGGTLFETYEDCKVSELSISAEAGQPLTVSLDILGCEATRLVASPASPAVLPVLSAEQPLNYNDATVTLGGVATRLIGGFELAINNNVTSQQTDDSIPYDVVEGLREVTLGFQLIFENLSEYNKFHYDGAAGTAQGRILAETSAVFLLEIDADNSLQLTLPHLAYQELSPSPDPGGDPIVVDVAAVAQRHATDPVCTAVVENQNDD